MDNHDIDAFERDIEEIQESTKKAANGEGSEDTVYDQIQLLGRNLGDMYFRCEGFNDYVPDDDVLDALGHLGEIRGDKFNPKLLVPNLIDENDPIVIPIMNPIKQYPDDE